MWKLAIGLALLLGLAASVALVPLHGRTVLDRWNASHGVSDFLDRSYREAKVALGGQPERPHPGRARPARPSPKQQARTPRPGTPTEDHSDADRAAVDRIIAERAAR